MAKADHEALVEAVAQTIYDADLADEGKIAARVVIGLIAKTLETVTPEMDHAARDWSKAKYGMPIGNDASRPCWLTQLSASPLLPPKEGT